MDSFNSIDFEEVINDDLLYLVFSNLSLKQLPPLLEVNRRWKDVCLRQLKIRTEFDGYEILNRYSQWSWPPERAHLQKSANFELVNNLLKLMPGLKSFKFDFNIINEKEWITLIETVISYNPLIQEFRLTSISGQILQKIITKFGSKIKVLWLADIDLDNEFGRSLFEGLPILEKLKMAANIDPLMFDSIPVSLKKLSLCNSNNEEFHFEIVKALINSSHSSSIECLKIEYLSSEAIGLICDNFEHLQSFKCECDETFNPINLRKLKQLKKLHLIYYNP